MSYDDLLVCLERGDDGVLAPLLDPGGDISCGDNGLYYSGDLRVPIVGDPDCMPNPFGECQAIERDCDGNFWVKPQPCFETNSTAITGFLNDDIPPGGISTSPSFTIPYPGNDSCFVKSHTLQVCFSVTVVDPGSICFSVSGNIDGSRRTFDGFNYETNLATNVTNTFTPCSCFTYVFESAAGASPGSVVFDFDVENCEDNDTRIGVFQYDISWKINSICMDSCRSF